MKAQLGETGMEDGWRTCHLLAITPREFGGLLVICQERMADLVLADLKKYPSVDVRFGLRCVGIEDLPSCDKVKVMVHQGKEKDGDLLFHAEYVLGADGSNSSVRRIMCIPFDGCTWPDLKIIGADVLYDFSKRMGYHPVNCIVHPEDWAVIAYTGEDCDGIPQWRVTHPVPLDLPGSRDAMIARA